MTSTLFLSGLKAHHFNDLFHQLVINDIGLLIDIRLNRDEGDVEAGLHNLNFENGRNIEYLWLRQFTNPFFNKSDIESSLTGYKGYLKGMDKELDQLYDLISKRRCCILDFDRDPESSHRRLLAETLKKNHDLEIIELSARNIKTA
jgi:hypothetical protein